jgi:glutathione peroxidase
MKLSDIHIKDTNGNAINWHNFEGKVLIFCNVARFCGFSSQINELTTLHGKFQENLSIILSPCNQFFQEPGSDKSVCDFYQDLPFVITERIAVNGADCHPLYAMLKAESNRKLAKNIIFWNFTKFLVSPDHSRILRYDPWASPLLMANKIKSMASI